MDIDLGRLARSDDAGAVAEIKRWGRERGGRVDRHVGRHRRPVDRLDRGVEVTEIDILDFGRVAVAQEDELLGRGVVGGAGDVLEVVIDEGCGLVDQNAAGLKRGNRVTL